MNLVQSLSSKDHAQGLTLANSFAKAQSDLNAFSLSAEEERKHLGSLLA